MAVFASGQQKADGSPTNGQRVGGEGDPYSGCRSVRCGGRDTTSAACRALMEAEYKVLLYVDSAGCSSCRLQLSQWKALMAASDSLFGGRLSFLLFPQPKSKKELSILFRREKFNHPVFIDANSTINRLNHFPEKDEYRCFLLDKNNKVQMIGNPDPVLNPKIWELYRQIISGQAQESAVPVTSVFVSPAEAVLHDLQEGKESTVEFTLKNVGDRPLLISRVNASCGCTTPEWNKRPVPVGEETVITLKIQPEEAEVFHKTVQVYCNVGKGVIPLVVRGKVKKRNGE